MKWFSIKKLESEDLIHEYEEKVNYKFPNDFIICVKENNGGYPELENFNTENNIEVFNRLYSFNKNDRTSIWNDFDWCGHEEMKNKYVVFACDPFGNQICFDKTNNEIVFLNHEKLSVQKVADCFSDFINKSLYKFAEEKKKIK